MSKRKSRRRFAAFLVDNPRYNQKDGDTSLHIPSEKDRPALRVVWVDGQHIQYKKGDLLVFEETDRPVRNWPPHLSILPTPNYYSIVVE